MKIWVCFELYEIREHCFWVEDFSGALDLVEIYSVGRVFVRSFVFVSPEVFGDVPFVLEELVEGFEGYSPDSFFLLSVFVLLEINEPESL